MIENLKVRDLIGKRDRIYSVDADDTTDIAALKLRNFKVRTIGVIRDGKLVGAVGQSDFSNKVVAMCEKPSDLRVSQIMSRDLVTVGLDSSFVECLNLMDTHHISHLIVLDENESYYGMISWLDLQKKLIAELKYQLEILHEYAFGPHTNVVLEQILRK